MTCTYAFDCTHYNQDVNCDNSTVQSYEFDIVYINEPQDENVPIGMDVLFSCTIQDNITMTTYFPSVWKITTSGYSQDYHARDLQLPYYTYNQSGLIVHSVNSTADGSLYACCIDIFIPSELRINQECSRAGRLNIVGEYITTGICMRGVYPHTPHAIKHQIPLHGKHCWWSVNKVHEFMFLWAG